VNYVFLSVYFYSVPNLRFTNNQLKDFKIVDICKLKQGNQYDLKQQFTEEKSDLKRFIRIIDYTQKTNDIRYVYSNGSENYVDCTDVVVVRYGASAGYVGRGINGIIANNLFTIRPINSALLNKSYLYHYLNAPVIQKQLNNTQSSGMPALNFQTINNLHILLPEYQEQRQIAVFLDKIDERIQTQIKIIDDLILQKKYIIYSLLEAIQDNEKIMLKDLLFDYNVKTTINNEYPVLSSTASGMYLQSEYFNKEAASDNTTGYKIIPRGYCTYRSMSDTGLFTFNIQNLVEKGIVSPAYPVFSANNYSNEFIILYLNNASYIKKQILELKSGGTRFALPFSTLGTLKIPKLEKEKQLSFIKTITAFERKIKNEEKILNDLHKQKNYLLNNMFI
ncbi:MAG: restriction endonuclease subunit S, partial [Clostridia bacterium]